MIYRRFGRTELTMPVLSCGGMRYQMNWKDAKPDQLDQKSQENLSACIHRALELGINHIETARGYGTSEYQLGLVLPKLDRESIIVQTKVAPAEDVNEFRRMLELSFELLQLERVDLLALHGINNDEILDMALKKDGCLSVLREYQRDGRINHVGFSTHAPCSTITRAAETGEFDYVNLHWYYMYQENEAAIQAATKNDMGVFIISPNDKGGRLYDPPQKLVDLCAPLHPMVFNALFCLNRKEIHTLSCGVSRPEDFDIHVQGIRDFAQNAQWLSPIQERLKTAMEEAVGVDFSTHWRQGIPEWQQLPGEINIRIITWLWSLAKAYDLLEYGKMRYNLLGNGGHWFAGKQVAEEHLSAIESKLAGHPHLEVIMKSLRESREIFAGEEQKRLSED